MAEVKIGTVVRSAAGRDKGDFQAVLSFDEKFVTVCDGKHRPLEKTKRKKIIHVKVTNTVLSEELLKTNKSIRKALKSFVEKVGG